MPLAQECGPPELEAIGFIIEATEGEGCNEWLASDGTAMLMEGKARVEAAQAAWRASSTNARYASHRPSSLANAVVSCSWKTAMLSVEESSSSSVLSPSNLAARR